MNNILNRIGIVISSILLFGFIVNYFLEKQVIFLILSGICLFSLFLLNKRNKHSRQLTQYTKQENKNQKRIQDETLYLLNNTTNFETYFSRYDSLNKNEIDETILINSKKSFLERIFEKEKEKISLLSTSRGKLNRWNKFYQQLQNHSYRFQDESVEQFNYYSKLVNDIINRF